jgi:hypothetical protein
MIDILSEDLCNFAPTIRKISLPNKPTHKHARLSHSQGVQSKYDPVDALSVHPVQLVVASPQQLSVIGIASVYIAGIERGESASEGKVHQGMDGWYFKQCSLTSFTGYAA